MAFINIRQLHDQWSGGQTTSVLDKLKAARGRIARNNRSEILASCALEAHFLSHSGFPELAAEEFNRLAQLPSERVTDEALASYYYALGYEAYEIRRDFARAQDLLERADLHASRARETRDIALVRSACHWRLASIYKRRGNDIKYCRFIDKADGFAGDHGDRHMQGIVLLAKGNADLFSGQETRSHESLLKGLFTVDYDEAAAVPKFLHAELVFSLSLAQFSEVRRTGSRPMLLNLYRSLIKSKKVLSGLGRGMIVTPYRAQAIFRPGDLLKGVDKIPWLHEQLKRLQRKLKRGAREMLGTECEFCGTRVDPTIDHIIPTSWGGTDWEGNVRRLCKSCNSSRGDRFKLRDEGGYAQIISHLAIANSLNPGKGCS